ncbi:threonine/serine ThrE exporter family protein [Xylocopilactobacillus apicola]|uniref:Membrane protein n=1 Tax=Xylocopilactobacillus apicola TaxID=2932184 RepID=A0AAU9DBR8_9LACO|nr:threonine/serine exporter family protein [Xylocopilactobacillus apicola]BDR58262.1 membrane protein [Xylocopilactobacillus apicola]
MSEIYPKKDEKSELSQSHHMQIPWYDVIDDQNDQVLNSALKERSSIVGRVGIMLLSCGTGAWRVREAMNTIARNLHLTCSADIGLTSISFTCFYQSHSYSEVLTLSKSGVNTDKLDALERFVHSFSDQLPHLSTREIHRKLDEIQKMPGNYSEIATGFAAALACSAFVFLLGGGPIEMFCCFLGAGLGNFIRTKLLNRELTLLATVAVGVAAACLVYLLVFLGLEKLFKISPEHEAGYIGAMLFVIPGFPFITSMLDISKQDLRSGLERFVYALMITIVATLVGWLVAFTVHLRPANFLPLGLTPVLMLVFRFIASFCGVFGFSVMFNSPRRMACLCGLIGAISNTLRLELVDFTKIPPAAAAFIAALTAGLIASAMNRVDGYPRISLTVPSIVIMVPGLYIYRGMYNLGLNNISVAAAWLSKAILIIMMLPLGLFTARVIMDQRWRRSD